jgi:hypothetical protein
MIKGIKRGCAYITTLKRPSKEEFPSSITKGTKSETLKNATITRRMRGMSVRRKTIITRSIEC